MLAQLPGGSEYLLLICGFLVLGFLGLAVVLRFLYRAHLAHEAILEMKKERH